MKKIILLGLFMAGALCTANAQEKGWTSGMWYQAGRSVNKGSELTMSNFVIAPGYAFNEHFFMRLHAELSIGLFDFSSGRTYEANGLIGASAGCNLFTSPEWGIVEFAATVGNTTGGSDWSYMYYDGAVRWSFTGKYPMKMSLGAGVRYCQSHNSHYGDYFNLYVGLGFRFN